MSLAPLLNFNLHTNLHVLNIVVAYVQKVDLPYNAACPFRFPKAAQPTRSTKIQDKSDNSLQIHFEGYQKVSFPSKNRHFGFYLFICQVSLLYCQISEIISNHFQKLSVTQLKSHVQRILMLLLPDCQ